MANYPRMGLSCISFACERPTVAETAVRTAIAYCFDRDAAVADYVGPFGERVDGYFGVGQWMVRIVTGHAAPPVKEPENGEDAEARARYEAGMAAYEALSLDGLNAYGLNLPEAARILDEAGWRLNGDGLREKDGVVLDLRLIYPEGNAMGGLLQTTLAEHLAAVGIRLTLEAVPMQELLTRWYRQGERTDDMIFLASNFDPVFDPAVHFAPDGSWNYTGLADEELYQAAVRMRTTEPGDVLTYLRHWIGFQERFNALLPMIPVYSNIYFDFYRNDLQSYHITEHATWGEAVVGAWIGEPVE